MAKSTKTTIVTENLRLRRILWQEMPNCKYMQDIYIYILLWNRVIVRNVYSKFPNR